MVGSTKTQARTAAVTRRKTEPDESTWPGRVGANLRTLREKRFATQGEAVDRINAILLEQFGINDKTGEPIESITQQAISRWERGLSFPRIEIVECVSVAYRCQPGQLFPKR